ncbi:SRPBCC family protein [Bacillus coahuilensis]|uniref:SRPBCC family protein n=1 Tax=Bacillus coahuilensis TaxID=408580 RepID=UPI000751032E|nr:SRPBCC domain-containing protein [Bacillus coahuilensis]
MGKGIHLERTYPYPREQVWKALTNKEAIRKWFTEHDLTKNLDELQKGDSFTFISKPQGNWDGKMYCELMESNKPHKLAYTFGGDGFKQPSVVTWELIEEGEGTKLILDHKGFDGFKGFFLRFMLQRGWKGMLKSTVFEEEIEKNR